MTADELRDEVADLLWPLSEWDGVYHNAKLAADAVLAIPAIREALAFHESCQKAFAVNGEFTVTKENLAANREGVWK